MVNWKNKIIEAEQRYPDYGHKKLAAVIGCSESCVRYHRSEKRRRDNAQTTKRRLHEQKLILVEMAGGKCARCGYDKIPRILHFHHLDDGVKDFNIGDMKGFSRKVEEIRKCELLCPNCHAETHELKHKEKRMVN